ncbi:hypothetical protein ACJJTC_000480 [Scirpophaga incertulas]
MEMLKPPPPFSLVGEPGENYKKWKQRYQIYYTASGASNRLNDEGKIALFLHCLGEECLPIYNNFEFTEEQPHMVYQNVVTKFDEYFMPMCNETMARHLFFKRKMRESETLDEYITVLRTMAKDCNFGATTDSLIKDQIIRGLRKKNIVERLLKEVNLDLPMCIKLCKTYEEDEENFVLSVKHVDSVKKSELYESVQLQSKIIDFKLDTGSDCDVLPLKYVEQLKLRNKVVNVKNGQKVVLLDSNKPNFYAEVKSKDVRPNSYKLITETGQKLDRNRKYFSISKNPDRMSIQKTYDLYDNNIHENNMYVNNDLSENCNDQSVNSESKSCVEERKEDKSESRVYPENYITRKGRVVKKPSYLNDYC